MRRYLFLASAVLALASCQSDDFIGNTPGNEPNAATAISFDGETGKMSRATTGSDAAEKLKNNFVVYGTKTVSDATSVVYNYYNVNYTAKDKDENDKTWKYAGQSKNSLNTETGTETDNKQTLKYWDYSASQYNFVAFSYGTETHDTESSQVKATFTMKNSSQELESYTLEGTVDDLGKCYVADRATAKKDATTNTGANYTTYKFGDNISLNFRTVTTKVKLGIYETIPGYSVKDVKFYSKSDDDNPDDKVKLITANNVSVPIGTDKAKVKVTFDENNTAKFEWSKVDDTSTKQYIELGQLQSKTNNAKTRADISSTEVIGKDNKENASLTEECSVIQATLGDLTLKVDYTLISDDGSGEEITVKGANVKISSTDLTTWKENTSYTYIFKISDNTNGNTGGSETTDPVGLYPITFDAVVTEPADGTGSNEFEFNKGNSQN